jgi:hypothetical protein
MRARLALLEVNMRRRLLAGLYFAAMTVALWLVVPKQAAAHHFECSDEGLCWWFINGQGDSSNYCSSYQNGCICPGRFIPGAEIVEDPCH